MAKRRCINCKFLNEALGGRICGPCIDREDKPNWKPEGDLGMVNTVEPPCGGMVPRGNQLPEDDALRGQYPMADGCLDYFPNALAEVSRISFEGNQKHNPGQPMHWARGKSTDHRNKIIRHTVDSRDDTEAAIEHAAQAAWRALALLQEKIEKVRGIQVSGASK